MKSFHWAFVKHPLFSMRLFKIEIFSVFVIAFLFPISKVLAQYIVGGRPGFISYADGDVYLNEQKIPPDQQNYPFLKEGQLLRTKRGRVEIQLKPAVWLRLGEGAELQLAIESQGDIQVMLQKGHAIVEAIEWTKSDRIQIQCADSSTELKNKGVYRFDADPGKLRVYGGKVEVSQAETKVRAESGKAVNLAKALAISEFSVNSKDSLHLWAAFRSFTLFLNTPDAMEQQTHWKIGPGGQSKNEDFHVSLFSPVIAREYAKRLDQYTQLLTELDARDRAYKNEQIREQRERERQQQEQQKQQQQKQQQQQQPHKKP
jgi:hypothetical protein